MLATPAMISAAGSAPFLPSIGGIPSEASTPSGLAPAAARSESAAPAARNPISLKLSQSVRKWTFSSEVSMLTARVAAPNGISAQSSPSSDTSPATSAICARIPRTRSNSLPGPRFIVLPCITTRQGLQVPRELEVEQGGPPARPSTPRGGRQGRRQGAGCARSTAVPPAPQRDQGHARQAQPLPQAPCLAP